jgi:predicted ester cyclase
MTVEDQVAEGDKVVTRWIAHGTQKGPFLGIPPTGKSGTMTGVEIDRFVDGKAAECWTSADYLGLMQQLGAIPEPRNVSR